MSYEDVIETISVRRSFIDGIVITGGEPTIHAVLPDLLVSIKRLGYTVKLDTNGYNPYALRTLLQEKLIDFIAMDIKTSLSKYNNAAGVDVNIHRIIESVNLIKASDIDFEFRTTCVPHIVDKEDIVEISELIGGRAKYSLQQFQPENTLDPEYSKITPYSFDTLMEFMGIASRNVGQCRLIGI